MSSSDDSTPSAAQLESESDVCAELLHAAGYDKGQLLPRVLSQLRVSGLVGEATAKCRDSMGRTALLISSFKGNLDGVQRCLDCHESALAGVSETDKHGLSALEYACWRGHTSIVDYLLRKGADPTSQDLFGLQPLHKAVGHGHIQAARRLLSDGACDPNARCGDVHAPAEYGARTKHQTALHVACSREEHGQLVPADPQMVGMLLRHGCNPNVQDDNGDTPLHHAAAACDLAAARMLLRHGGRIHTSNLRGLRAVDRIPHDCSYTLYEMLLTGEF